MKLLIVDDEELTRTGVITSLDWASLGIDEVLQADDGVHGLETARLCKPELILCDVRMPRMDGISMLERLEKFLPDTVPMSPTMPCSAISESLTTVLIRRFPSSFSPPHLLFSMLSCNSHVSITNYNTKIPEWVSKAVEQAPQRFRQKSASMRNQYRCFENNIDYLSLMLPFLMPQSAERF